MARVLARWLARVNQILFPARRQRGPVTQEWCRPRKLLDLWATKRQLTGRYLEALLPKSQSCHMRHLNCQVDQRCRATTRYSAQVAARPE